MPVALPGFTAGILLYSFICHWKTRLTTLTQPNRHQRGRPNLLVHNRRELAEHILVMGLHLPLVLKLILLNEALVHIESVSTRFCKLPASTKPERATSPILQSWTRHIYIYTHTLLHWLLLPPANHSLLDVNLGTHPHITRHLGYWDSPELQYLFFSWE